MRKECNYMYKNSVQLYCIHNTINVHCFINTVAHVWWREQCKLILTLSIVNTIIEAKAVRQSSTLLLKPRLSVNRQCCCWLSNAVIEAKKQGFWLAKKTRWCQRESMSWLLSTVYLCMAYYWLEMGKRGRITQMTATWRINVLLVLTTISGLPLFGRNVEVTA